METCLFMGNYSTLASRQLHVHVYTEMVPYLEAFKFYAKIQQRFCKQTAN